MDYFFNYSFACIVLGIIFGLIDAVWLKKMRPFYEKEIGGLLRARPDMTAAVVFYVIYVIGVISFVIQPALQSALWWQAGTTGLFFGIVAYATYDLTNLSTLKGWSKRLAFIDIAWGGIATGVSSVVTYYVVTWF